MEIKVRICRTADDFNAAYAVAMQAAQSRLRMIIVIVIGTLIVLSNLITTAIYRQMPDRDTMQWIGVIVLSLILWAYMMHKQKKPGKKLLKDNPTLGVEEEVTIFDEGLNYVSKTIDSHIKWAHFIKAGIGKDVILLHPTNLTFQCYPKRFFTNAQYEDFCTLVRANIKEVKEV